MNTSSPSRSKRILRLSLAILLVAMLLVLVIWLYYRYNDGTLRLGISGKIKNKNPKKILFVGDSITASDLSYPKIIERDRPDLSIDVLAKAGMPTSWMLTNLPGQLGTKKYDRVYIYGGVNDAWNDSIKTEKTLQNLQAMVDMINSNGADAFIIIGYEPDGVMDYTKMPVTIYQHSKEDNIPLIDKYKKYQDLIPVTIKNASFIPKININGMTLDGIHPSTRGQNVFAQTIENGIKNS